MTALIFDDTNCALGEGPLWHPDRQTLFWFDIDQRLMYEKAIGGSRIEYRFDRTVTAAGLIDESHLLIASERDLFRFDLNSLEEEILCPLEADRPETRSNDGRADPRGGFWIGTMGYEPDSTTGAIYRFYQGSLQTLFDEVRIPNSICFSPDGSQVWFTDSQLGLIWRVNLDKDGWPVAGSKDTFVDLSEKEFAPDGAVCDVEGQLWSAQWMASRVAVYSSCGMLVDAVALPTSQTTCPAFGGPDLTTLFVTSAGAHLPDSLKGTQPKAGCTFMIENAGRGQPEHRVDI